MSVSVEIRACPCLKVLAIPWVLDAFEGSLDVTVERQDPCTSQELRELFVGISDGVTSEQREGS